MTHVSKQAAKVTAHIKPRDKPKAHAFENKGAVWIVDGRLVSKTLADPEIQQQLQADMKKKYPNKAAVIKEFQRRGILTPTGKLTKAYGG